LRGSLNDHEDLGHVILSGAPADKAAFIRQQHAITRRFADARVTFPRGAETTGLLDRAEAAWRSALTNAGLWGDQVAVTTGAHADLQAPLGTQSDMARALLDRLQEPSLESMRQDLSNELRLERLLMITLLGLLGAAFATTLYFRRRMATDMMRPVADMHEGVRRLQAGEYAHRITVVRHDELGELAEAFNTMADALQQSHVALTLRATRDSLTGLPNRASLLDRLATSFSPAGERRAAQESVLFIDVDDFKDVNDSVGHEGGDLLLVQFSARLSACVRAQDLVARLGGDEFAIVMVEEAGGATAADVAERILVALREPFTAKGTRLLVSVSIGVAQKERATRDAAELLRHADFAMYMAKGSGKGCYRVFDARVHASMVRQSALSLP
jgi:diguanylate cyclase (GGDEF)-like protein